MTSTPRDVLKTLSNLLVPGTAEQQEAQRPEMQKELKQRGIFQNNTVPVSYKTKILLDYIYLEYISNDLSLVYYLLRH